VLGVKVPRVLAEQCRTALWSMHLVDRHVGIVEEGGDVVIPLVGRPEPSLLRAFGAVLVDRAFPSRDARIGPIEAIRAAAAIPESLKEHLPDKWELFGDVAVIRFGSELDEHEAEIGRVYASVLGMKTVLRDAGGISGDLRMPVTRRLFGTDTVALHKENGVLFRFDAERIMFSSGNIDERMHMATVRCDGETVVDMFAGIGYFSVPLAVYQRPRKIVACELNPVAHSYLVENVSLNKVSGIVEPVLGDNRGLQGEAFADRVIMGYVKTTHEFLPTAMRLVKDGGIIHYHETCPNELLPSRPLRRLTESAGGRKVEVLRMKEIKSYAPGVSHVVVDAKIFRLS